MSKTVDVLPGAAAQALLETIADWGSVMTIIQHAGSVFEFKGSFPKGSQGHGYYNLNSEGSGFQGHSEGSGFQGHLALDQVHEIRFQDSLRGGRESYAFVFCNEQGEVMFKIFLGRDEEGGLFAHQVSAFQEIREEGVDALSTTGIEA